MNTQTYDRERARWEVIDGGKNEMCGRQLLFGGPILIDNHLDTQRELANV